MAPDLSRTAIGLDIGGTKCAVLRGRLDGMVDERTAFPTAGPDETVGRLFDAMEALAPEDDPLVGISCGSPLDARAGVIQSPPNLPGWDDVRIVDALEERFGGQALLMNDANAGALAELFFGAGRDCRHMIFCTHGTGFGAGVISHGRLIEGATGDAGEIGHVRLREDGPVGYGKAGSVEGFCSGGGIARWAALRGLSYASAQAVAEAAAQGDEAARTLLADSGTRLGQALAILVDLFNPERIVLGSLYARCGERFQAPMRAALAREALARNARACWIVASALGEQLGDLATLALVRYRLGETEAGTDA
jgi:glucokinase